MRSCCPRPRSSRAWCARSPSPAILSFCSAPARSPNGPMRCRANSPLSTRPEAAGAHDVSGYRRRSEGACAGFTRRLVANAPIAETTWFRVGGPAQVLFSPADEDDLAGLLSALPLAIPVTASRLGSNLIIRDGGVEGAVIRLGGRAFNAIDV